MLNSSHRLIGYLKAVFKIAVKDGYIDKNPADDLNTELKSEKKFKQENGVDNRHKALIEPSDLKEFLIDLKNNCKYLDTKRAIYLQILTGNRAENTVEAKWADIDLEKGIWTIKNYDMKIKTASHTVMLSTYTLKVLQEQYLFSQNSKFVFPSLESKSGHLTQGGLYNAMLNLGKKKKYLGKLTAHGWRSTFKTICSLHQAELLKMGIGEKVIEECLAHKESNDIIYSYERARARLTQKFKLMQ